MWDYWLSMIRRKGPVKAIVENLHEVDKDAIDSDTRRELAEGRAERTEKMLDATLEVIKRSKGAHS